MLEAARALFVEHGYGRTTMEAIAERAQVGVATVYTYFGTKEGVFASLARMDCDELREEGESLLREPAGDPVAVVVGLLHVYSRVHEFISYELIRDFIVGANTAGPLRDAALWNEAWMIDQLAKALLASQAAGSLARDLPVRDAAHIVCDLLYRYYERAVSAESERAELEGLERSVTLLFRDWRRPEAAPRADRPPATAGGNG